MDEILEVQSSHVGSKKSNTAGLIVASVIGKLPVLTNKMNISHVFCLLLHPHFIPVLLIRWQCSGPEW